MKYDAFTAGVEPGGLRSRNEIRILVCYLLTSVKAPLAEDDLVEIIVENGLANYFEVTDAIAEMAEKGNIILSGEMPRICTAGDSARMISKQLDFELPPSVREKALCAALNLLDRARREKENTVDVVPAEHGYCVTCHISGGAEDLMNFSLYVPDLAQAGIVKKNFQDSPETVYRMLLALMTGNRDIAAGLLGERLHGDSQK